MKDYPYCDPDDQAKTSGCRDTVYCYVFFESTSVSNLSYLIGSVCVCVFIQTGTVLTKCDMNKVYMPCL